MVPVDDALDILLVLLTFRKSSVTWRAPAPRLPRAPAPFAVVVALVAFEPVAAFRRPDLGFSLTILARAAVAKAAAALAGEAGLTGE